MGDRDGRRRVPGGKDRDQVRVMEARAALTRETGSRIDAWLAAVERVPPDGFTDIDDFERFSGEVRADSWGYCDGVFVGPANPHDAAAPRRSFHCAGADTIDLLRHSYE